jgi:hypothetical protein
MAKRGRKCGGKDLNLRDLEIMQSQEIDRKTYEETMEEIGICRDTIARTKKKQAYRDIVIAALEQESVTAVTFAQNLKKLMDAKRTINIGGEEVVVDDNVTRFNAVKKHGDILGVDAPKTFDLKHSMAAMADDELQEAIDESIEDLDGRLKNQVTGTPNAGVIATNKAPQPKSTVARRTGKPKARPTDS